MHKIRGKQFRKPRKYIQNGSHKFSYTIQISLDLFDYLAKEEKYVIFR